MYSVAGVENPASPLASFEMEDLAFLVGLIFEAGAPRFLDEELGRLSRAFAEP